MAGIVASISYENKNVMDRIYELGLLSRNRGTQSYIIKAYGDGGPSMMSIEDDRVAGEDGKSKIIGSKGMCFVTKNPRAKTRISTSDFMLDGYLKNKEELGGNFQDDISTVYTGLEYMLKKKKDDLEALGDVFSKYAKGIGILNTDDGFIVMRDRTGFRTGWIGHDYDTSSEMFVQEDYLFGRNVYDISDYREIECGEVMKVNQSGKIDSCLIRGDRSLKYDVHEIIGGLDPRTKIFGKTVHEHRESIGANLAEMYQDELVDQSPYLEHDIIVTSFPEAARPASLGFFNRLKRQKNNVEYDEVYFKLRDSSLQEQQKDFSKGKEFHFYYNDNPYRHPFGQKQGNVVKEGDVCVALDDSLMTSTNAGKHRDIMGDLYATPIYVSMQVPVVNQQQVGYFTWKKNEELFSRNYLIDIHKGKIPTISKMNEITSRDLGYKVLFNTADGLASSIFGDVDQKDKLSIPDYVKEMPFN